MTRPKRQRRISVDPEITFFKPSGVRMKMLEQVDLSLDELESMRLKFEKGMDLLQGARKMKISKSTFQRLIVSAQKKIVDALVNGKAIKLHKVVDFNFPFVNN